MYSLIIPEHIVKQLYLIRVATKNSIRNQILTAIEEHIQNVNLVNSAGAVPAIVRKSNKKRGDSNAGLENIA